MTGDFPASLGSETTAPEAFMSVFVPTTPNPTSGWYAIVRETDTIPLQMPVEDAFKLLISGGIVKPDSFFSSVQGASNVPVNLQELAEEERMREAARFSRPVEPELMELKLAETESPKRFDI